MKRVFLFVVFALFFGLATFAQDIDRSSNPYRGFDPYWYLNLNAGRNLLWGDLQSTPVNFDKIGKQTGFIGGGLGGYQFTPFIGLRGVINGGTFKSRVDENPNYHFKSKTHYFGYYLEPTLDFTNLINYNPDRRFFLYGFAGLGFANMYSDLFNYTTGTETTVFKTGKGSSKWTTVTALPYGVGTKYKFDENWGVNLEVSSLYAFNKTDGDKLDGIVQGEHRDGLANFTVGINYDFVNGTNLKKMAENFCEMIKYVVTPNPLEMHGDSVVVTIKGTVPEKYMLKKAAILITPELKYNGGTYLLNPITLKGEEVAGDGIAISYKTGGSFTVKQTIPYIPGMYASDLMTNPLIYKPTTGTVDASATAEQIRSKNKFVDVPSCKIADGVIVTPLWIKHDEDLLFASDKRVIEKIESKDATIYFIFKVNKFKINWKLPLNAKSKVELDAFYAFINQGWRIKNIDIEGFASPEGHAVVNQKLSELRASSGKEYVIDQFRRMGANKNATEFQKGLRGVTINTIGHGGDWEGFRIAVQNSSLKEKDVILNILNTEPDADKRDKAIKKLKKTYRILVAGILPPLRRTNIKVNSFVPDKTNDQILSAATSNPETLNNEELLYSTTLTKDPKVQLTIYQTTLKLHDGDWRAFNNAGVIELENGDLDQATGYLNTANTLSPNNVIVLNNLGALEASKGHVKAAAALFQQAQSLGGNENYNTGIPLIGKARYNDAITAFNGKTCSHNLGLAQLLAGNSTAAIITLKCAPAAADTYYLLAVAGARTNDSALLYDNLMKSIKMNNSFKAKAAGDREFIRFFNTPEFQAIVK